MPALVMRGRYVMREYWSDSALFTRLNPAEREIYVGLWMLADDDGWLPRDIEGVSAALFRYEAPEMRRGRVRACLKRLQDMGKVASTRCCIYLPAVSKYPRAGRKSTEHHDAHRSHAQGNQKGSKQSNALKSVSNASPDVTQPVPSLPDAAGARAPEPRAAHGLTSFRDLVAPPPGHRRMEPVS